MWLKIDDNLIDHPKFHTAGRYLGKRGRMRAFTVYMAGLSWTNRHLSDGMISMEAVGTFSIDEEPIEVARVLTLKSVKLWHKTSTGFRIHDYHDHNPKAVEIKEKRQQDRDRKRHERGGLKRRNPTLSNVCPPGQIAESLRTGGEDVRPESRALARARSGSRPDPDPLKDKSTDAGAPVFPRALDRPTHRQLCALLRDIRAGEPDCEGADLKEALKVRCTLLRWDYFSDHGQALQRALDASDAAHAKRSA